MRGGNWDQHIVNLEEPYTNWNELIMLIARRVLAHGRAVAQAEFE